MTAEISIPGICANAAMGPAPGNMGNGLFASADIPPGGNVLVIQTPFVAALNTPSLEDTCSGCFGQRMDENHEVKACTGCGVVKYCDRVCHSCSLYIEVIDENRPAKPKTGSLHTRKNAPYSRN